jgi:hypothetical protein
MLSVLGNPMKNFLIAHLIQWLSNVGVMTNEFPIEIHASESILEIKDIGGSRPLIQNLDFSRIYVNSGFINYQTQILDRDMSKGQLFHIRLQLVLAEEVTNYEDMLQMFCPSSIENENVI